MDAHLGCLTDGEIRALIDDEMGAERRSDWAEHVSGCERCRMRLNLISENAGAVAAMLNSITPPIDATDEQIALRQVRARRVAREPVIPMKGETLMSRIGGVGRRGAIAGVAILALMVIVVAAVPLSSLAENMLTRFRVQQFSAITIPMDLIQQDAQAAQSMDSGTQAFIQSQLADLGQLNTTLDKNSLKKGSSIGDAQSHLNGTMQVPSKLSSFSGVNPTIYLSDAGTISYKLNVQKARDLLSLGNIDPAPLPDPSTTPTVTISLDVPAGAALDYESNGKHLIVAQMESPTLSIPSSVDISMLRDEMLATGFLPPDTVSQLRSVTDWEHTLIVPVPSGATTSNVTVQDSPGLLIKSDQGSVVMWQKDGILHVVGSDSDVDVMSVASSMQ
jgi:hypothetical protein